jgi:hypothetical protein
MSDNLIQSGSLAGGISAEGTLHGTIAAGATIEGSISMAKTEEVVKLANAAKIGKVTLSAAAWVSENDKRHSQIVEVEGVTNKSQVDLTPDVQQLEVFYEKDVTFVTKNLEGEVTVFALGQKPLNDYTVQVTLTDVVAPDGTAIWGITVGTPMNPELLGKVNVDAELSDTSTNPIQNKAVTEALQKKSEITFAKNTDIDKLFN